MHRTIGYLSKRFVQIRPGEGRKVFLTFLYFFLIITAYYVIKPVSRSLVLDDLGNRMVPYADLVCALLMGPIVTLFARVVDRLPKPRLVTLWFWTVSGVTLIFWKLLFRPLPWLAGAFYIWVAIFSVLVVTLFWLVANDLYRARDAKRLFGFIGSGGILGGITGSSIAAAGAQVIGTQHLLLLSAGLLLAAWVVVEQLWRLAPQPGLTAAETLAARRHETFLSNVRQFAKLLGSSRYFLLLIALVGLNKIVATLVSYQLNPFIEQTFPTVDAKTTFTGLFLGAINVTAFIVQFFLTSWVLRRWGLQVALLTLPIGLLIGSGGLLVAPLFALAASTELYDRSLDYSLNNTAKEVLYLPIDRSIRYKVKPFIDMVVFRFGKGIAAVLGIILLDGFGVPARYLSLLTIPLVLLWLAAVVRVRREYAMTIRTVLQAHAAARGPSPSGKPSASPQASEIDYGLGSLVVHRPPDYKLSLAARLVGSAANVSHGKELLSELEQYEGGLSTPTQPDFPSEAQRLKATIQDQRYPLGVRRQAVRSLARRADQDALDYLCGMLVVEEEAALRHDVVRGLVKIRLSHRALQFPLPLIRRQVAREVRNYERIAQVTAIYRQHHRGPLPPDDPVTPLLRVLLEESVEQIFRLLMLLYRPADIHLVFEQMRSPDLYVRADAIELLENLMEPGMRAAIFPILDEDRFLAFIEEMPPRVQEPTTAYRLLQEAIWDHNCWLSVTTLCAVGRLRLTTMRQELERASRHTEPIVSAAAKVALHFSDLS